MKAEKLENYPIKKRGISKQNNSKEGAGNYSNLKILIKIWARDNIVKGFG